MATELRVLDDGAWISVDNDRRVATSDVWVLPAAEFCPCEPAHVLVEAFSNVAVDGATVVAMAVGQCIDCGASDSLRSIPVGRLVDGDFRPYEPGRIQT